MPERSFELEGSPDEILFRTLEPGDAIVIDTMSGLAFRFSVFSNEGDSVLVAVERSSDHRVRKDSDAHWREDESDILYELRGSCKKLYTSGDVKIPKDRTPGHFVVGERAWLDYAGGDDRPLVTSAILEMKVVK